MSRETRWTLDELGSRVHEALATADYQPASSARVRAVPDRRTIRYYTTLGLIDRPAEMRGRTAYYSRRHLLQLVAIKRLQADGLTLAQVQERLTGLAAAALEAIAQVPASPAQLPATTAAPPQRPAFWAAEPAPLADANTDASTARDLTSELQTGVRLAGGITLLLPGRPRLSSELVLALRQAATPLLRKLEQEGIIDPPGRNTP